MPEALAVEVSHLSKQFGPVRAVDDLSFTVRPGRVTGFLGPNGAGKTTTLRCLLGLVRPTSGTATIGGTPYHALERPGRVVGAALEAASFHPGRTALDHLRVYAPQIGVPDSRASEVLHLVGLGDAAKRRVGGFSLGMRQRLALATTLLGDPPVLLLDEPANGLDPEGISWLRGFMRALAAQGRTVLVSSHVLSEVQQTVDDVVIVHHGRLVREAPLARLAAESRPRVRVTSPDGDGLAHLVAARGWQVADPASAAFDPALASLVSQAAPAPSNPPTSPAPGGATPGGPTPGGVTPGRFEPGGPTPGRFEPGGPTPGRFEPGGPTPGGVTPGRFEPGDLAPDRPPRDAARGAATVEVVDVEPAAVGAAAFAAGLELHELSRVDAGLEALFLQLVAEAESTAPTAPARGGRHSGVYVGPASPAGPAAPYGRPAVTGGPPVTSGPPATGGSPTTSGPSVTGTPPGGPTTPPTSGGTTPGTVA